MYVFPYTVVPQYLWGISSRTTPTTLPCHPDTKIHRCSSALYKTAYLHITYPRLAEPTEAEPTGTEGWLYACVTSKSQEHPLPSEKRFSKAVDTEGKEACVIEDDKTSIWRIKTHFFQIQTPNKAKSSCRSRLVFELPLTHRVLKGANCRDILISDNFPTILEVSFWVSKRHGLFAWEEKQLIDSALLTKITVILP